MSPDNGRFPNLRRIAEEATARRNAEASRVAAQAQIQQERLRVAQVAHELERQQAQERHERARTYMDKSEFPGLITELEGLYNAIGRGNMASVRDGWPYRLKVEGGFVTSYSSPIEPVFEVSSIGVNWSIPSELTIGIGRFTKTFRSQDIFGLFVIADYTGRITVLGAGSQVLNEDEWNGNTQLQADVLNRAFENPFTPTPVKSRSAGEERAEM